MVRAALLFTVVVSTVAVPASAGDARSTTGTVVVLTQKAIAVEDARGVVTTCARTDRSPRLTGVQVGAPVQIACARAVKGLVLVKARTLQSAPANDSGPVTFAGTVSGVTGSAISVRDGDHELTCALGEGAPSAEGVEVGQRVKVQCADGKLTRIFAGTPPTRTAVGTITALTGAALTIHNDEHGGSDVTCKLGDHSPPLGDFHVGDRVGIACARDLLVKIVRVHSSATPPSHEPPQPELHTAAGTITALTGAALTIHNDEHGGSDVTCKLGDHSPPLGDFHVGDRVGIACARDLLVKIAKLR